MIESEWGESDNKRKARFYRLTKAGRKRLVAETENWNRMTEVIGAVLRSKTEEA